MAVQVELTRFKVKKGKTEAVDRWMKLLNDHMPSVLLTLQDEKMYVETIFRERQGEDEFLYWYSVQGDGGLAVEDSLHEIDKQHLAFWEECIDPDTEPVDLQTEVSMIQEKVLASMT